MHTQYLELDSGSIAYDDTGSGPVLICVPGMGDLRGEFRYLAPQLAAAGYRVITMDVRGHGETSATWKDYSVVAIGRDIVNLVQHLNAGPAIILGNSMAAGAAIWAAAEYPNLVRALILLDPAVRGEVNLFYRLFLNILFARPWGTTVWSMYYKYLFRTRKPADLEEFARGIRQNLEQPGRLEALRKMMVTSKDSSECRMRMAAAVPGLVIMGSKDPDFKDPQAEAEWVAKKLKADLRMIEGSGHYPHTEMPEVTTPQVIEFLNALRQGAIDGAAA